MSKHGSFRQFHTVFWASEYVEQLDPSEKLLYAYMILSPLSNMEGVYKTSIKRIAFETGFDRDTVVRMAKRFEGDGKAGIFLLGSAAWVVVCNAPDHVTNWSPSVNTGFRNTYEALPDEVHYYMQEVGYRYPGNVDFRPPEAAYRLPEAARGSQVAARGSQVAAVTYTDTDTHTHTETDTYTPPPQSVIKHPKTAKPMNQTTYDQLLHDFGATVVDDYFQRVADWCSSKGKRYKDHAGAVRNWLKRDGVQKRPGVGVVARGSPPPEKCSECGGEIRTTSSTGARVDFAQCRSCGAIWEYKDGAWRMDPETKKLSEHSGDLRT